MYWCVCGGWGVGVGGGYTAYIRNQEISDPKYNCSPWKLEQLPQSMT